MPKREYDPAVIAQAVADMAKGKSCTRIARKLGVHGNVVRSWFKKYYPGTDGEARNPSYTSHPKVQTIEKAPVEVPREVERAPTWREWLDVWQFVNRETKRGDDGKPATFKDNLWPGQMRLAELMEQHQWILALKGGKLGFTELACAWDGYIARFGGANARVHLFSRTGGASKELLDLVRYGLERLPEPWRVSFTEPGNTMSRLKFRLGPDDMRVIVSYSTSAHVSIETSCLHAHVDELAHMKYPQRVWEAVCTTVVPKDGTCHIVTRGQPNYLMELWEIAADGKGRLVPYFADWKQRPGRDSEWKTLEALTQTAAGLGHYAPETPEEALLGDPAESVFHREDVLAMADGWKGLQEPQDGRDYISGWDIGRKHDATVGITIEIQELPMQVVAFSHNFGLPYPVAIEKIDARSNAYWGSAVIDSTGQGDPIHEMLQTWAEPFIFSMKNKKQAIDALKLALEKREIKADIPQLTRELLAYKWDDKHLACDCVMAMALACWKAQPMRVLPALDSIRVLVGL